MNNRNKSFSLAEYRVCTACLLLFAMLTGGMSVQAVDVNNFTELQNALSSGAAVIDFKANIDAAANLNSTAAPSLTINGSGFILNGAGTYSGFHLLNGQTLTLENINLNSFSVSGSSGGAIHSKNSSVTIRGNANFTLNSATANGGAIYNYNNSSLTIGDNAAFTSNSVTGGSGGAIYNLSNSSVNIGNNASFASNSASNYGGAIYNGSNSSVTIGDNAAFISNSASSGGAIRGNIGSTTTLTGNALFIGNTDGTGANDIYLNNTATLNINGTGDVVFGGGISSSSTNAVINKNSTGNVTFTNTANNTNFQGTYTQTAGTTNVYGTMFSGNTGITDSTLNLLAALTVVDMNGLSVNNADINTINNVITTFNIGTFNAAGTNNFSVDINGHAGTSDQFNIIAGTGSGTLNIEALRILNAPTAETINVPVFIGDINDYTFTTSKTEVTTPVYNYKFRSDGGGTYSLLRGNFNTEVFRGQAAKLAVYQNQLIVNNTLFDHVYLDSNERTAMANKYAVDSYPPLEGGSKSSISGWGQFAPYQFTKKDGAIWTKTYATFERLSMTHGLNVANNAYGQIIGADFPVVELSKGWKFLPTAYISYNGGHQTFNGVSMYQNGGQGGFMGTFNKGDFIGSVLAYGGGYNNEMSLAGNTENTGNWFAGTAVKGAYNIHATRNFIIQPNLLASYNIFGKQNWYSNYGALSMNSGLLNGINVAPGLNLIYGRETWSVYLTALYMYNINDSVGGRAGSVNLPSLSMRHGYLEYGVGATKTWKDRLSSYVQFVVRNGGRTGVGFQLGLTWKF